MCEALIFLLDNMYIRFGSKLYRQNIGILMGSYCTPLVADLCFLLRDRLHAVSFRGGYLKLLKLSILLGI